MNKPQATASSSLLRALGLLAVTLLLTLMVAGPARAETGDPVVLPGPQAAVIGDGQGGEGRGVCANAGDRADTSMLPVNRWAGGTDKFHDRLHGSSPGDIAKNMQRQGVVSLFYAVGNGLWKVTAGITEFAINFCILDQVGGFLDRATASIGKALLSSGIVAAFAVASVFLYVWRIGRGNGGGANTSGLVQKALILALFGIMLAGAAASTGGGIKGSTANYKPGAGSPGWFVTQIDGVVSASANQIAGSLQAKALKGAERGPAGYGNLGCAPYVKSMKDLYVRRYGDNGVVTQASAAVPLMLSNMWEVSGLEMWKKAQFGEGNPYPDYVYCRMLEYNANVRREPMVYTDGAGNENYFDFDNTVTNFMKLAGVPAKNPYGIDSAPGPFVASRDNLAFRYSTSNTTRDKTWVGWAACASGPGKGNDLIHTDGGGSTEDLKSECGRFFTATDYDGGSGQGEFDWDTSDDDITDAGTSVEAEDYLLSLHGNRNTAGTVGGLVYMVSALLIALIFIVFSLAIMVAKVAALMFMLTIFFTLLMCMLPNANAGKLAMTLKQYFGMSLFAWGAQLVMSMIALMTAILVNAGNAVVPEGPGGVMGIMWTGFAPVVAVVCLHFIFKQLKVPSPLKVSGGMAWGQMAATGAIAGAAGMGMGAWASKASNRVKGAAVARGKKTVGGIGDKTRKNRIAPKKTTEQKPVEQKPTTTEPQVEQPVGQHAGQPADSGSASAAPSTDAEAPRGDGPTSGREAVPTGAATKAERRDAKQWAKSEEGKAVLAAQPKPPSRSEQANEAARAKIQEAVGNARTKTTAAAKQFADKPVSTMVKGAKAAPSVAKKAAIVGGVGMAVGATGGTGALAIAGAAVVAKKAVARRAASETAGSTRQPTQPMQPKVSSAVEAHRSHLLAQQQARIQAEQESMARAHASVQPQDQPAPGGRARVIEQPAHGTPSPEPVTVPSVAHHADRPVPEPAMATSGAPRESAGRPRPVSEPPVAAAAAPRAGHPTPEPATVPVAAPHPPQADTPAPEPATGRP